jgi:hypothetical protein
MIDKTLAFKTANQVIKELIIPGLQDGVAKEQGIALISFLRNLEMWTVENNSPKEQLITLIKNSFEHHLQNLNQDSENFSSLERLSELKEAYQKTEGILDVAVKWKRLNELQCKLIQLLYEERAKNPRIQELYIFPLREQIREQLNIEMSLVR